LSVHGVQVNPRQELYEEPDRGTHDRRRNTQRVVVPFNSEANDLYAKKYKPYESSNPHQNCEAKEKRIFIDAGVVN
jgi:hypothetical protein